MVDLPKISEEFTADASGYIAALQAMIAQTNELIGKVSELKSLVDSLDGKTIAINVGGDALEQLDLIASRIDALDDKTVTVNVVYQSSGDAADIAAAQQTVNRVFAGNDNNISPVIQQVIQQVTPADTGALRTQFENVVTNDTVHEDIQATAEGISATTAALQTLQRALDENGTSLAGLKNALNAAVAAARQLRNATGELSDMTVVDAASQELLDRAMNGVNVTLTQQRTAVAAAAAAQQEMRLQSAASADVAQKAAAAEAELTSAHFDSTGATLAALDATLALVNTDKLLADANAVITGDMSKATEIFGTTTAATKAQAAQVGILAGWWTQWGTIIHWVISAGAEWLATAVPGMIAMAAAIMVAAQAAQNVYQRLEAMYTVQEALGPATNQTVGTMLGLGDSFQKAQNAMQPQLYGIYGAAIDALKGKGSELATMGEQIVSTFSTFAAKVDVELKNGFGTELQGLISKGAQDFTQFGQILGNVGHAIVNFAAAMPGLAEVLLKLFDVLSQFLKIISEIPAPIITAAMAFEEFLRWGSLLNGMIAGLIGMFSKFAGVLGAEAVAGSLNNIQLGMKGLTIAEDGAEVQTAASMTTFGGFFSRIIQFAGENPWAAIAVAVAVAAAAIGTYISKAKSGMDQWISSVSQAVKAAPDFSQINTTVQALSVTTSQLSGAQETLNSKTSAWSALSSGAQQNVTALKNAQSNYIGILTTESVNVGVLSQKLGVDMPTAIAIAQGAGVKLTDTLTGNSNAAQVNWQKIQNEITGYQALGQQGNQLVNSIDAVTVANSNQISNVGKLNSAWSGFVSMATSLTNGFTGLQTNIQEMGQAITNTGSKFETFRGGSVGDVNAIAQALTSFQGTSAGVWQNYNQGISQANTFTGALRQGVAVGVVSYKQFTESVAYAVGQLLPFASQSKAAVAELSTIAQQAGGPATNSFQTLSQWVDKNTVSSGQFNNMLGQMTTALSNVNGVASQLQGTMQTDVINSTAQAVLQQGGFQAALNKTYAAFKSGGASSGQFKTDLSALDNTLKSAGMNSQQISQYNDALTKSWTEAGQQAQSTAGKTTTLNNAFTTNGVAANGLRDQIKNVFIAIGHEVEHYSDDAGTAVVKAWKATASAAEGIWDGLVNWLKSTWGSVVNVAKSVWNDVKNVVVGLWQDTVGFVQGLGDQFSGWWKTHGDEVKQVWHAVWGAIKEDATLYWDYTVNFVKDGWDVLKGIFNAGTPVVEGIWHLLWDSAVTTAKEAWAMIGPLVKAGIDVVKNLFDIFMADIKTSWDIFWTAIKDLVRVAWAAIIAFLKISWDTVVGIFSVFLDLITGHWSRAWTDIKNTGIQVQNAIHDFLVTFWNNLSNLFTSTLSHLGTLWDDTWHHFDNILRSVWNGIMGFLHGTWNDIVSGFNGVVNGINTAWSKLQSIFQGPVNFLVHTVYDDGIARLWNDVAGVIPGIPHLPTLASGGRIPGYGGGDNVPALLERGETVVSKEHSAALADVFRAIGVPGYAAGGVPGGGVISDIFGGITDVLTNPLGVIKDIGSVAAALLTGNTTALANDMNTFLGNAGGASGNLANMIVGIPKAIVGDLVNFMTGKSRAYATSFTSVPGPGITSIGGFFGLNQDFLKAIALTGAPVSWLSDLETIAKYESGFNPNAINLSDSNAAAGDPSRGLMQTIMATFTAYHQAGTSNNIYDPVANIAAAINYIRARYGTVFNVPGIQSLARGGGYMGYDSGGYLMPGLTLAYNGTGRPEMVSPPGAGSGGQLHAVVNIDGKSVFDALTPYAYQKASRNSGNVNAGSYWTPGSRGR